MLFLSIVAIKYMLSIPCSLLLVLALLSLQVCFVKFQPKSGVLLVAATLTPLHTSKNKSCFKFPT